MKEDIFKINGYPLDDSQRKIITSNDKYLLVSAGAGSGKTLTIIGKVRYLIEVLGLKEDEIMCISFTNEATNSLKKKLLKNYKYNIPCYTFHKLGLEILSKDNYIIANPDELLFIISEFFECIINNYPIYKKMILYYLDIKYTDANFEKRYSNIDRTMFRQIKSVTGKFISLLKANDLNDNDIIDFIRIESNSKNVILLLIILFIYRLYKEELLSRREIDFDDMISLATKMVIRNGFSKHIKYIIIDEFQDTSLVRFNLIKAILDKTNANLLVVGDDFQSIYRFTGCDLALFLDFKKLFPTGNILKIENTYRNSQELIDIAGSFIMKNSNQLNKNLNSYNHLDYPIEIIYYRNIKRDFIKVINYINSINSNPILVLGRNNSDVNMILDNNDFVFDNGNIVYTKNPNISIYYLTIHKSKGLEEENVIIINLINRNDGFPNKLVDHDIISYVKCKSDSYPYSEERRLMYVALTRTKGKVYLFVPVKKESIFVTELKKDFKKKIKIVKAHRL